jgi:hypothetical protein
VPRLRKYGAILPLSIHLHGMVLNYTQEELYMLKEVFRFCLRFKLNRRVEILEHDEELEKDIAPEVGIA